jgi:hypothetical protein
MSLLKIISLLQALGDNAVTPEHILQAIEYLNNKAETKWCKGVCV